MNTPADTSWLDDIIFAHAQAVLANGSDSIAKNHEFVSVGNKSKAAILDHLQEQIDLALLGANQAWEKNVKKLLQEHERLARIDEVHTIFDHPAGGDLGYRALKERLAILEANGSQERLTMTERPYRDIDGNRYTQVTTSCPCGRGGFLRLAPDTKQGDGNE